MLLSPSSSKTTRKTNNSVNAGYAAMGIVPSSSVGTNAAGSTNNTTGTSMVTNKNEPKQEQQSEEKKEKSETSPTTSLLKPGRKNGTSPVCMICFQTTGKLYIKHDQRKEYHS